MPSFAAGDRVVLREVMGGKVWTARPMTVVVDDPDAIVLHLTVGTIYQYPDGVQPSRLAANELLSGEWKLVDKEWYGHDILRITVPGQAWDVWWPSPGTAGDWYVNFQEPLRRAATGFDTMDHVLDLIVSADGSQWRWKDQEDFRRAEHLGILSPEMAKSIRQEADSMTERLATGELPWDSSWAGWTLKHITNETDPNTSITDAEAPTKHGQIFWYRPHRSPRQAVSRLQTPQTPGRFASITAPL